MMPPGYPPGEPIAGGYLGAGPQLNAGTPPNVQLAGFAPPSLGPAPPSMMGGPMPHPGGPPTGGGRGEWPPPPSLTQGIPDPGAIARQKDVYLKMLDEQLKQSVTVLDQQVKYQRDYLNVQCEQQKKQFLLQLDQQMKAQEMVLTQQYNEQLMNLQMQAGTQKGALEQQAMQLTMEYEQRKAEENMYRQQYEMQRQQTDLHSRMTQEHQRMATQQPGQPLAGMQGMPPYMQQLPTQYGPPSQGGYQMPPTQFSRGGPPATMYAAEPIMR